MDQFHMCSTPPESPWNAWRYATGLSMYWDIKDGLHRGVAFGMNALSAYVLSGLLARLLGLIQVGEQSLREWIFNNLFLSWLEPYNASLAFAIVFVLCLFIPSWILYRKGIIIKV